MTATKTIHCLKSADENYSQVSSGAMAGCQVRRDDRPEKFKPGDTLLLCEYITARERFTGKITKLEVGAVVDKPGLEPGYVAMSTSMEAGKCYFFSGPLVETQDIESAKLIIK